VLLWYIELYRNKFDCYANMSCNVMFVLFSKSISLHYSSVETGARYLIFFKQLQIIYFFFDMLISKSV
jgi:hypothetical protein